MFINFDPTDNTKWTLRTKFRNDKINLRHNDKNNRRVFIISTN